VFANLKNVLKIPDLRNKVLFTLGMVALYRLGANIPVPGIDLGQVAQLQQQAETQGAIGFLNLFSGGALSSFAVFALGIMPYITASIIMQVLGVAIPKLQEWQEQGAVGQRKITQWTRYLALAIATLQATGLTFIFGRGYGGSLLGQNGPNVQLLPDGTSNWRYLMIIMTLVGGTAILMWMGELITQRGIGNGMSILIFCSVVSQLPYAYYAVLEQKEVIFFLFLVLISLLVLVAIIYVELGQRRIPVQFAKRVVGRRMYGGQSTYIPLKVNQSGVIPIIFASSLLLLPVLITNLLGNSTEGWRRSLTQFIDKWVVNQTNPIHLLIYGTMIVGFAYFYNAIAFDPAKQADQLRKQGGFIPGIRPGPQTERYLSRTLNRLTLPGAVFLAVIALLPSIVLALGNVQSFPFGGTSVLIAVGVALETMKQIDSQLMLRNYEGFLK
jgi:preprotein translocase subunit SecY